MPRDIVESLFISRHIKLSGEVVCKVRDICTGECYFLPYGSLHDTRQQLAAFMKEWADRGTGNYVGE